MKTRLFLMLFIVTTFCSKVIFAQDVVRAKSFIELSGGMAIPMGNFTSAPTTAGTIQNAYNSSAGYAQPGTHFALNGTWYITPNIGIGGSFSTSSYRVNVNALANEVISSFDCDSATAEARNYNTISLMAGPYFALPLNNLTIEARVLGGITNTTTPDFIMQAINQPSTTDPISISKFVQTSGTANAFGFDAGLGVRYKLINHLSISLRGDYFYSKPNLTFDNIGRLDNTGREIFSYNQPISGISATFGVGYVF